MLATENALDVTTPEGRLAAYAKLRGSLDGRNVVWWYRGFQYGVVDMRPRRLWGLQGLQVGSFKLREDGSYENRFRELLLHLDPYTGEVARELKNPYTDETVRPPPQRMGPMELIYSRAGAAIKDVENVPPGFETDWRVDRAQVNGDDVILNEEGYSRVTAGPTPIVINDFISFLGSLSELQDPDIRNARGRFTSNSMSTWPDFMNMGGHEGYVLGRGTGHKLTSRAELDPAFLEAILAVEPDWLDDVELPAN